MQRLKLYHRLDIQRSGNFETNGCLDNLDANDDDIQLVKNCFSDSCNLNDEERSTLYYISGYVAYKEGLGITPSEINSSSVSEFLTNVSREIILPTCRFIRFFFLLLCILQS